MGRMEPRGSGKWITVALLAIGVQVTRADVTGSYDGQASGPKLPTAINAAATFTQTGKKASGTIAIDGALAGSYLVNGSATPKKLKVKGFASGTTLKWKAKIVGDSLSGPLKLKGASKAAGILTLARNPSLGDGAACDSVYNAHTAQFTDQVLAQGLVSCSTCHQPGLQAGSTRLLVNPNDPLATARSVSTMIDSATPAASRLLVKPLLSVPHGGNQQILAGSQQETILLDWATLIAQAQCN